MYVQIVICSHLSYINYNLNRSLKVLKGYMQILIIQSLVSNEFTRLPDDLKKIKVKNDKKSELMKLNQHIKTRSKQIIHKGNFKFYKRLSINKLF